MPRQPPQGESWKDRVIVSDLGNRAGRDDGGR
jgi:hypothetical protein